MLRDPAWTALVIVAMPEEMAVVEALELRQAARTQLGVTPSAIVLNACHERRFTADEEAAVLRLTRAGASGRLRGGVPLEDALLAASRHLRRARLTRFYERRLRRAGEANLVRMPFLYDAPLESEGISRLADVLADA
jgi:hypothetical protein